MRVGTEAFMDAMPLYNQRYGYNPAYESPEDKAVRLENERADRVMARAEAARVKEEQARATRESTLLDQIQSGAASDESARVEGGAMLTRFVWDADQSVSKMRSMIANGDFVGARGYYEKFCGIVSGNLHDIAKLTQESVARLSGETGVTLAKRGKYLLDGLYNQEEVVTPDGERRSLADVLSKDGSYEGWKRRAFQNLGFSGVAADMYFGQHGDVARSVVSTVMSPRLAAHEKSQPVLDGPQTADLMNFLTQQDKEGNLPNMARLEGLFGSASAAMMSTVLEARAMSGDFRQSLENYMDVAEILRRDGESGAALATRVNSWVGNLQQRTFEGIREAGKLTARDMNMFDAVLSKTLRKLADTGRSTDITRSSFGAKFAEIMEQSAWADSLGIDLVGEAADSGLSYTGEASNWLADSLVEGLGSPGFISEIAKFRGGVSGIRGARNATHLGGPRVLAADAVGKALAQTSDLIGLDGLAFGFTRALANSIVPELRKGQKVDAAWAAVSNTPDKWAKLGKEVQENVNWAMPTLSKEVRETVAGTMLSMFKRNGGAGLTMQDVIEEVLSDDVAGSFTNQEDVRRLRIWYAVNTDNSPEVRQAADLLLAHYTQESPHDPARARERTAATLADAELARFRGESWRAVVDNELAFGRYLYLRDLTDNEKTAHPELKNSDGTYRRIVAVDLGDRRKVIAAGLAANPAYDFDAEQEALRLRAQTDERNAQAIARAALMAEEKERQKGEKDEQSGKRGHSF